MVLFVFAPTISDVSVFDICCRILFFFLSITLSDFGYKKSVFMATAAWQL